MMTSDHPSLKRAAQLLLLLPLGLGCESGPTKSTPDVQIDYDFPGASLAYASLELDPATHRVARGARTVRLGPTEFRLLRHFMEHPRRVFTRGQLIDAVWGVDVHVDERTVDVHIRRLRKALNEGGEADLVRTVRAAGYALDEEEN